MDAEAQRRSVSAYYGDKLKSSTDLKTSACCPIDAVPEPHRAILARLHPDVTNRFYGCGSPIPEALAGATVLDLGCGTGRDAFVAAALAGPRGRVIGVDMTDAQLAVARAHAQFHADAFFGPGATPTTDFRSGLIEDLAAAGIADASVDVVISNCVCNLAPDKRAVFAEVARVLRDGGEFHFSDVYADRRLSPEARAHPVLVAECLGGALYLDDFRRVMTDVGFADLRVLTCAPIEVHDSELHALVRDVQFYSLTVRAFKIEELEDRRESYGQYAVYNPSGGSGFKLDVDYNFVQGVPLPVDGNTAAILQKSRFSKAFSVTKAGPHQGLFSPEIEGGAMAAMINSKQKASSCCPSEAKVARTSRWAPSAEVGQTENGTYAPLKVVSASASATEVASSGCCGSRTCC